MTGGWTGGETDSTDFVDPGNNETSGSVTSGPTLPGQRRDHCIITLHDGSIMFIGIFKEV